MAGTGIPASWARATTRRRATWCFSQADRNGSARNRSGRSGCSKKAFLIRTSREERMMQPAIHTLATSERSSPQPRSAEASRSWRSPWA